MKTNMYIIRCVTKIVLSWLFTSSDINECEEIPDSCGDNTECFNTNGSYYCQCKPGFKNHKGTLNFTAVNGQCLGEFVCVCVCVCVCVWPVSWSTSLIHLHLLLCQITMSASILSTSAVSAVIAPTGSGAMSASANLGTPTTTAVNPASVSSIYSFVCTLIVLRFIGAVLRVRWGTICSAESSRPDGGGVKVSSAGTSLVWCMSHSCSCYVMCV